jgi:hypothetical protein
LLQPHIQLIAKIITTRLKPIFSGFISDEQFGFLDGCQIHEAISIAQEVLHSFKSKKVYGFLVKLDLSKAYDKVRWIYVRLALIQMGLNLHNCQLDHGMYRVLVSFCFNNEFPSSFICPSKGIRQGFPLSPFIFLLVVDDLSRLIVQAIERNLIKGIKLSQAVSISHLLFVDDVILFGAGLVQEVKAWANILDIFCKATGMQISATKSMILTSALWMRECCFK